MDVNETGKWGRFTGCWPFVVALAVGSFSACERPRSTESGRTVSRDSGGVEIIVSHGGFDLTAAVEVDTATPNLRIGQGFDRSVALYDVGSVLQLSDRRVIVENRGSQELLVFDADGELTERWGGRGPGPGEFGQMRGAFACRRDTTVVVEPRRLTVLDSEGSQVRRVSIAGQLGRGIAFHGVTGDCGRVLATKQLDDWESSPRAETGAYVTLVLLCHKAG